MTAAKTTPMTVSVDKELRRCKAMMASPTARPKSGMVQDGLTAKINPSATPAKAEWPMASAKKAMRKLMTWTPMAAAMGATRSRPIKACCMKRACRTSNGRRRARRS